MRTAIRITMVLSVVVSSISHPSHAARNDVLVIVNDNSIDSVQVGSYYATQRDVAPENVVHVRSPNQYHIGWSDFQSLRDQILRFGICPTVPPAQRPAACGDTSQPIYTEATVNALTAATPVRYIVMTRGVPTQFTVQPADPTHDSLPPVDNYLRFWLARFIATDMVFGGFKERERAFGGGEGMRTIRPAEDREYAIGRVDGVNLDSAIRLVDRALAAEQNGVYGKLYGSAGGDGGLRNWQHHIHGTQVYPGGGAAWRWLFGTFNEDRPECSDYTSSNHYFAFGQSTTRGRSPTYCNAQFHKGDPNELAPAHPSSRHPMPTDSLVYMGSLDGQTLAAGFTQLLNWRREANCQALCSQTPDPAACRATSTDPVKEINTACVGVAPGFIGYQHQSYPVAHLGIWPTAWTPQAGGASVLDVPRVDATSGYDDSFSLWFDREDEVASPQCYAYANGVLSGSLQSCKSNRSLALRNAVTVTGIDASAPPSYRLQFRYNAEAMPVATSFNSRLVFVYPKAEGVACPAALAGGVTSTECTYTASVNHNLGTGNSNGWVLVDRTITPPSISGGLTYTSVRTEFVGKLPGGRLGLDAVSLTDLGSNIQLLTNGSFAEGHRQTGSGDHAAVFLDRLGGTAFWGSTSHHFNGGHAFEVNALETLIYFMRGLPLAEAVWFNEDTETGLLYGDPLYSPIAVRLTPINRSNFVERLVAQPLSGSTLNGRGALVDTVYSVQYCSGSDPYLCGTAGNPWLSTGIENRPGKFAAQTLGTWNTPELAEGDYMLRLSVTSTFGGKTQTFNDFLPIRIMTSTSDFDGDGLSDRDEVNVHGTDPKRTDTDGDGLSDPFEISSSQLDPNRSDTDGDGVPDGNEDTDGDGYTNLHELSAGGDPLDVASLPLAFVGLPMPPIFHVETGIAFSHQLQSTWPGTTFRLSATIPAPAGMVLSSDGLLTWTPDPTQGPPELGERYHFAMLEVTHPELADAVAQFTMFVVTKSNTGDVNEDGIVDVADTALVQRHVLGLAPLSARQTVRADLAPHSAPDGVVDMADLQALGRSILELE